MTPLRTFLHRSREILAAATARMGRPLLAHEFNGMGEILYSSDPERPVGVNSWTYDLCESITLEDAQAIVHAVNHFETLLTALEVQADLIERIRLYGTAQWRDEASEAQAKVRGLLGE